VGSKIDYMFDNYNNPIKNIKISAKELFFNKTYIYISSGVELLYLVH